MGSMTRKLIHALLVALITTVTSSHADNLRGVTEQIEEDGRMDQRRRQSLQSLTGFGGDPREYYPLGHCEGDCDDHHHCQGHMICWQRFGGQHVPGCSGGEYDFTRTDYCVYPEDVYGPPVPAPYPPPVPAPTRPPTRYPTRPPIPAPVPAPVQMPVPGYGPPLSGYGGNPPDQYIPLRECEGDCDTDADCHPGLYCHQRDNFDPIPGCSGNDATRTDYCVRIPGYVYGPPAAPYPPPPTPPPPTPNPTPNPTPPPPTPNPTPNPTPPPPSPTPPVYDVISNFRLKLYWEEGYYWQEERFERRWCMECNGRCRYGRKVYIQECGASNDRFDFIFVEGEYVLIRVHDTNLCFERDFHNIFLMDCDHNKDRQLWFAQNGNFLGSKFEIIPKTLDEYCLTQRHHPKANEEVELERTYSVRRHSDTSYWEYY